MLKGAARREQIEWELIDKCWKAQQILVRMKHHSSELWRGIRGRWIFFLCQKHANIFIIYLSKDQRPMFTAAYFKDSWFFQHTFHSLVSTVLSFHVLNSDHEVPLILYRHSRDPRDLLLHHLQRRPSNHRSSRKSRLRPRSPRLRNRCLRHARHTIHTGRGWKSQQSSRSICRGSNSERCQSCSDRALGQNRT